MGIIGAAVLLATGALIYKSIEAGRTEDVIASQQRQKDARVKQRELEDRISATNKRAQAIEEDNKRLVTVLQNAQAAKGTTAAATTAREAVEARFKHGQQMLRTGQLDAALTEFLWCYDEGMPGIASYNGIRNNMLPNLIGQIAKTYPPALAALRERRDKAEQRMFDTPDDRTGAMNVAALNTALGEPARNLELFDRLPAQDPQRQMLLFRIFDQLVEARRYSDVVRTLSPAQMAAQFDGSTQQRIVLPPTMSDSDRARFAQMQREGLVKTTARNIEVLAGAGDLENAQVLAGKLLSYDNSDQTKALLRKHADRAGHPELFAPLPK